MALFRLKITLLVGVIGVTLGGAGPLFAERADGATPIPLSKDQKNAEKGYMNPLEVQLLIKNSPYYQDREDETSNGKDINAAPHKKGPSNTWRIVLAAETTIAPFHGQPTLPLDLMNPLLLESVTPSEKTSNASIQEKLRQLEEILRSQQNLIRMANFRSQTGVRSTV